ncbi:MAG: hypothetical protein PWR01_1281 [Clostridiales bacterium]|jgi:hypothetical protein|nr:hypothetical protein [Clostridiales bacterium]
MIIVVLLELFKFFVKIVCYNKKAVKVKKG